MQLSDFFDSAVVLGQGDEPVARATCEQLAHGGCRAWVADLAVVPGWREAVRRALAHAHQRESAGILLLLAQRRRDGALWSGQDALVEHLAERRWDIVFLGHGECTRELCEGDRPGLLHCDLPPADVSAVAVSCEVLQALLDTMPDRANDGPLTPADWMTIACWLAMASVRNCAGWAAWPPLAQAQVRSAAVR